MHVLENINHETLMMLAGREHDACVSLYMPVIKSGKETRQNAIRLKELIDRVEEKFCTYGVGDNLANKITEPLKDLVDDMSFWATRPEGVAFFASPGEIFVFKAPIAFQTEPIVDKRFYIRPLLPLIDDVLTLDVVLLSRKGARLVRCGKTHYEEIKPPEHLRSLDEFLKNYEFEESLQFSSNAGAPVSGEESTPGFHGQGVAGDDATDNAYLQDYYHHFKNWLAERESTTAPLYLAGDDRNTGTFIKMAGDLPGELRVLIRKNIRDLDDQDLKASAGKELERLERERIDALYGQFLHIESEEPQKAIHQPGAIVTAAHDKRIETLFIPPEDRQRWGHFDEQNHRTILERNQLPTVGEELFNLAAIRTLQNGGQVIVQDSDEEGAAICRW